MQHLGGQRVDGEHQPVVVVVHRVAGQRAGVAQRGVALLGDAVAALRRLADNVRGHDVPVVERRLQCVLGVREDLLCGGTVV